MSNELTPEALLDRAFSLIEQSCPPDHSPLTTAMRDIREAKRLYENRVKAARSLSRCANDMLAYLECDHK